MYDLYIDESGSLHPSHQSNFLTFGAFLIPSKEVKRLKNVFRKILAKEQILEIKGRYVPVYFPIILQRIESIWPRPKTDYMFLHLDKRKINNLTKKNYSFYEDDKIRAYIIYLLSKHFIKKCKLLNVTFDEFYGKESINILDILNIKYKLQGCNYSYGKSNYPENSGLQIAHCTANRYAKFIEEKISLPPYLRGVFKEKKYECLKLSKDVINLTKMLFLGKRTTQ